MSKSRYFSKHVAKLVDVLWKLILVDLFSKKLSCLWDEMLEWFMNFDVRLMFMFYLIDPNVIPMRNFLEDWGVEKYKFYFECLKT